MNTLDPELKTKWVEALRSGKYKQGKYWLRSSKDEFCCLGVLCDVAQTDEMCWHPNANDKGYSYFNDSLGNWNAQVLPPDFNAACKDLNTALLKINGIEAKLTTHNDDFSVSFEDIAKAIEEQL